ncbi:hypothetical protein PIB30_109695, partial [Stylosanthes scabra]|nr:hypothetical protein [Stylosanthes scabra]
NLPADLICDTKCLPGMGAAGSAEGDRASPKSGVYGECLGRINWSMPSKNDEKVGNSEWDLAAVSHIS